VVGEISPAGLHEKPSTKCWVSVFKEISVPDGTIDQCWQSLSGVRDQTPNVSIVPNGTDLSFCIISQHFVLGYFHHIPPGRRLNKRRSSAESA
jgi:hypothetical protein